MSKSDVFLHEPLPYVVTVRIVAHDDAVPERREIKLVSYSVFEAMLQASLACGGEFGDPKIKVECVAPDVEAYLAMLLSMRKP